MSITVVVTRDYDNVPSCFEKYELGTRWRVNGGNLEIFVDATLAALYPSGNWISVYVDDAMQVHKGSDKPDYSGMPTVDTVSTPAGVAPPVEDVAAELYRADGAPWTVDDDDSPFDEEALATTGTYFPDDVVAARAGMTPVAFRPRRYRGTPPPAKKAPTGPRMLPIKLRMRRVRPDAAEAPPEPAQDQPRMMRVSMRTTIYRAARPKPDEPPADTEG